MIQTHDLTKVYGSLRAIDSLELSLGERDVFGFIGPNGAGKTTTMKILTTLLEPSWGEATVCGYSIYTHAAELRRVIGYMPDFFGVYEDMQVIEYLEFFAAAYRIRGEKRRKRCEEMLELVDLGYKRNALVTSLSRGMTQRLGLARVLLHDPQVLLLDEPASGLDPRARIEIRTLLKELSKMGKTIMVSSHILPELADVCNKIGIIERGKLLVNANVEDVLRQVRRAGRIHLTLAEEQPCEGFRSRPAEHAAKIAEGLEMTAGIEVKDALNFSIQLREGVEDYSEIPAVLAAAGIRFLSIHEDEINLETAFMTLTRGITS
ncbi:MAG: ABC transporter ATP-binding protein [Thermoguttaceae bacterium]|nr:ABC transporter ATP-binding protein [Planctomycetaceae bacterium]MBQ4142062.1 ABC transporter ATP-binding protein [Thermoguttaceae bacterium]